MSISDKVAVVCGSTSGIGKATAILLAQRGCKLILLSRNEDKLKKTIDELSKISNVNHDYISTNFDDLSNRSAERNCLGNLKCQSFFRPTCSNSALEKTPWCLIHHPWKNRELSDQRTS